MSYTTMCMFHPSTDTMDSMLGRDGTGRTDGEALNVLQARQLSFGGGGNKVIVEVTI